MSLSEEHVSRFNLFRARLVVNFKPFLVMLGWGTNFATATLWAIFQGFLLPKQTIPPPSIWQTEAILLTLYYVMVTGIAFLSGLCIGDLGKTIVAFLGAYLIAAVIVYEVLFFPGFTSTDIAFRESLSQLTISWTFLAIFPLPLFMGLFGGIIGSAMEETIVG